MASPVDGVVFGLVPSSPAGYSSGETCKDFQEVLEAKVYVTNRDVGFLKGMNAQVRVDAFPYTQLDHYQAH